MKKVFTGEVR